MNQFNFRIGNIEARTNSRQELEIVQWQDSMCWTIVGFERSRDTSRWNARFVEDRPFHADVNWKHLRELIQASYKFLEDGWEVLVQ